jgi:hypothetical protein
MTFQELKDAALLRGFTLNSYGGYVEIRNPSGALIQNALATNGNTVDQTRRAIAQAADLSGNGTVDGGLLRTASTLGWIEI